MDIPIWEKLCLTVEEAASYSNIGENEIRKMAKLNNCPFVLNKKSHILIKRKAFEDYINNLNTI